jgi:Mg-chelatase subunit ChlD
VILITDGKGNIPLNPQPGESAFDESLRLAAGLRRADIDFVVLDSGNPERDDQAPLLAQALGASYAHLNELLWTRPA